MAVTKWQKGRVEITQPIQPDDQQNLPISDLGEQISHPLFFFSVTSIDVEVDDHNLSYEITSTNTENSANISVTAGPNTTIRKLAIDWMCIGD